MSRPQRTLGKPSLARLSPVQFVDRRKRKATEWESIMAECAASSTVKEVAARHPELSYYSIVRRYKRRKEADPSACVDRRGSNRRIFSDTQETVLHDAIAEVLDKQDVVVQDSLVRQEAKKLFAELHPRTRHNERAFCDSFIKGFKARVDFTERQVFVKTRAKNQNEEKKKSDHRFFKAMVQTAVENFGANFVLNIDETFGKFFDVPQKGWGKKGKAGKVVVCPKKSPKAGRVVEN